MSKTNANAKRPTQRSEMSKWQWTWKEMMKRRRNGATIK